MKKIITDFLFCMVILLVVYGVISVLQNASHFTNK